MFVMKVGVIAAKFDESHNPNEYMDFLAESAEKQGSGLLVGPDYALAELGAVNSKENAQIILEELRNLSLEFPELTIVPGTMPVQVSETEMTHSAYVLNNGNYKIFDKQTDHGEAKLAEKFGLRYRRAKGQQNLFYIGDKKAWLHICGDRGRKPESRCEDSDIEIILAHDTNAGFHMGAGNPKNSRYIVLADSHHPKAEVLNYSPSAPQFLKKQNSYENNNTELKIFDLK